MAELAHLFGLGRRVGVGAGLRGERAEVPEVSVGVSSNAAAQHG